MRIKRFDIQHFRRLQNCSIYLHGKQTVFVGANNSGKTSAMDALSLFIRGQKENFQITDFSISNWKEIDKIGNHWIEENKRDLDDEELHSWLAFPSLYPHLDLWFDINNNELHYCFDIIPNLEWDGGNLGIRIQFELENPDNFRTDYLKEIESYPVEKHEMFKLTDFIKKYISKYFMFKYYVLDDIQFEEINQQLPEDHVSIENPLKKLIRLDFINAQRGFSDANDMKFYSNQLSSQLASYYEANIDPEKIPITQNFDLIQAIVKAQEELNLKLEEKFDKPIGQIKKVNYPGFNNPSIKIKTRISVKESIANSPTIQYKVCEDEYTLPEKSIGLGYQNLISMVFKLMQCRDNWMKVGTKDDEIENVQPIHLMLVEEPEAHLHPQAQIVFMKEAYNVLREHTNLEDSTFTTQLVVSTHSNNIAYETKYSSVRYFKRDILNNNPVTTVISLEDTFDSIPEPKKNETERFVTRYLKLHHSDIFFADAVILIEGAGEKILMNYFIENACEKLSKNFITVLEIGGSHAHRLRPIIEKLGIFTLIISDIDPAVAEGGKKVEIPELKKGYVTSNYTLKKWIPGISEYDKLINLNKSLKEKDNIRIAYQTVCTVMNNNKKVKVYPYTFEDCLLYENTDLVSGDKAMISNSSFRDKIKANYDGKNYSQIKDYLKENLTKAAFALDVLYDCEVIKTPEYIREGLLWLEQKLNNEA